jgi:hypothetical protein
MQDAAQGGRSLLGSSVFCYCCCKAAVLSALRVLLSCKAVLLFCTAVGFVCWWLRYKSVCLRRSLDGMSA